MDFRNPSTTGKSKVSFLGIPYRTLKTLQPDFELVSIREPGARRCLPAQRAVRLGCVVVASGTKVLGYGCVILGVPTKIGGCPFGFPLGFSFKSPKKGVNQRHMHMDPGLCPLDTLVSGQLGQGSSTNVWNRPWPLPVVLRSNIEEAYWLQRVKHQRGAVAVFAICHKRRPNPRKQRSARNMGGDLLAASRSARKRLPAASQKKTKNV